MIQIEFAMDIKERLNDIKILGARVNELGLEEFRSKDIRVIRSKRNAHTYWRSDTKVDLASGAFLNALVNKGILKVVRRETVFNSYEERNWNRSPKKMFKDIETGGIVEEIYEMVDGRNYKVITVDPQETITKVYENKVNVYKFTGTDLVEFKQKLIDDVKNYFENELKRLG